MKRFEGRFKNLGYFAYRMISPVIDPLEIINGVYKYPRFIRQMYSYSSLNGSEPMSLVDTYPILSDAVKVTPFDSHYFYQDIWAARKIFKSRVKKHYDVGSNIEYVGFLSTFTKVIFIDIRPLRVNLKSFTSVSGNLLSLPFKNGEIKSVSCLHVAEHIGLGRYGDKLDPEGTKKGCREMSRVLAKGGNLYFSVPVGKPRLCFNAHRIHSPNTILEYFNDLELKEFSTVTDEGKFIEKVNPKSFANSNYACGLFWFTKK